MTITSSTREALLRPIVFSRPLRLVDPTSWVPHIPFAFWLVDALRPRSVVELGTMSGNSFSAFAQAVQTLGLDTACYAIDTWSGDPHSGIYGEEVFTDWNAFHEQHFNAFSRVVRSTFDDAREKFPDGSIDLLHIDGFHTYDAVRHDFESWLPKLSGSAVVILHDTNVREQDFGVWRFWNELASRYPSFAFLHGHGLGVLGVGRSLPLDLRLLLEETSRQSDDAVIVRQFFAALGTALLRHPLEVANRAQQAALGQEIRQITARLAEQDAASTAQQAALGEEIKRLTALLEQRERELGQGADGELQRLQTEIGRFERELAIREARVREKELELQTADSRLAKAADLLATRDAELLDAQARLANQRDLYRAGRLRDSQDADRWKRLVLLQRSARTARVSARLTRGIAIGREVARRARFWKPVAPGSTPLVSALRPRARRQARTILGSGLFDAEFYLRRYPEVVEAGLDPIVHFLVFGAVEGRCPHPLFDGAWYLRQMPEGTRCNPLLHYLETGWREGRSPHPLFDVAFYLGSNPSVAAEGIEPLGHYLRAGASRGLDPHPLFDTSFYLERNLDVASSGVNPLVHYLEYGGFEGRNPHPLFHSAFYLAQYGDVALSEVNPLVHFVLDGARDARNPNPWFDTAAYVAGDGELRASGENALQHFIRAWPVQQRSPSDRFDLRYYARANPDAAAMGLDPLTHYVLIGEPEGRRPLPPPTPPIAGDLQASSEAYDLVTRSVREAEAVRIGELALPEPPMIRLPEDADLAEYAHRVLFSSQDAPDVSIVIPLVNGVRLTLECLLSIAAFSDTFTYEVVVVDNGSSDGTEEILKRIPNLTHLRYESNTGFVRGCNAGAAAARGRFLVFLNNDAQVTQGWLAALVRTFSDFDRVAAVGPKVLYPNGRLQDAGSVINPDCSSTLVGCHDDPRLPRFNVIREVDYVSGVCLMVEADSFRRLGGFADEYAPAYCEDVDLCLRLRQEGLRIIYQPASVIVHHLSATSSELGASFKRTAITRNQQILSSNRQAQIDELDRTKLIAFYLPQFHPIPENDVWWGKGFTEWRNVTRARPNFEGHHQPRLASDLGFYDLRAPEPYLEQVALAARYGVDGFCFYYYWFDGKRLLERPIERLVTDSSAAFPFCLCWANENWTRRWDGMEHDVLMAQSYREEDDIAVIADLMRYVRHSSYIRVNGRPLLLIYHASRFPDILKTVRAWRSECRAAGIGEIYLAMVESFELSRSGIAPQDWGFDAAVEFPPHQGGHFPVEPGRILNPSFTGRVFDYNKTAQHYMTRPLPGFRRFRTVMPGWDNTARRQNDPVIFSGSTPGGYQAWLESMLRQTREQNFGDEQLVFINAWNEWAEGTYLEPDLGWGHGYLEATRDARDNVRLGLRGSVE